MAYRFVQRSDKGFDFFNDKGQKTTIEDYTKNTGANQNTLRTMMAQRGDQQSQQIMQQPSFKTPQLPPQFKAPTTNFFTDTAKNIGNFTAGANEQFLGGLIKAPVNIANYIGSGFNNKETEKRTNDFLRSTGQINKQGNAPLSQGSNRNSEAFKWGQAVGTTEATVADIASMMLPGAAIDKAVKGTKLVGLLNNAGKIGKSASYATRILPGSLYGTGVNMAQMAGRNEQIDPVASVGIGTAADLAIPLAGKLISKIPAVKQSFNKAIDTVGGMATNSAKNTTKVTILKQANEAHINMATALDNTTDPVAKRSIVQDMIATQRAKALANSPELAQPKYGKVNDNEAFTLKDFRDYKDPTSNYLKDITNPQVIGDINQINVQARNAAKTAGVDIVNGSPVEIRARINDFLAKRDAAIPTPETNIRTFIQRPDQRGSVKAGMFDPTGKLGKETPFDVLPSDIHPSLEAKAVGAKRIAPDRVAHQQLTVKDGIERLVEDAKNTATKRADGWLKVASDTDTLIKKYGDTIPARTKANLEKYPELQKDFATYDYLKKNTYGNVKTLSAMKEQFTSNAGRVGWNDTKETATRAGVDKQYRELVKKDISKGYRYPDEVLNYDKSFRTAIDNRARYEKGVHTSFSSDDSRIVFDDQKRVAGGMKRQDGKELSPLQKEEIVNGVQQVQNALGINLDQLAQDKRLVYAHLNGKNPFLTQHASGLYRAGGDHASISVGGTETFKDMVNGKQVTKRVNTTMAHELGHALDLMDDKRLLNRESLWQLKGKYNSTDGSYRSSKYWNSDAEITARAVAQYVQVAEGSPTAYTKPGNWNKEIFDQYIKPSVEDGINNKYPQYKVAKPAPQVTKTEPNRAWKLSNQVDEGNREFTDAQHAVSKKMDEFRATNNGKPFTDAQKKELNVYIDQMDKGLNLTKKANAELSTPIVTKTPLGTPVTPELPAIAKQVTKTTANQKVVEPSIVPSTKVAPKAAQLEIPQELNKKVQSSTPIISKKQAKLNDKARVDSDLKTVTENLNAKYDNFERSIYGDTTSDIKGGTKGATVIQDATRYAKEGYNKAIAKGMSSENDIARRVTRGIRTLFGSAGDTAERISKKGAFRGGIDESVNLANDFKKMGDDMLPDKASQERVWAVLDPELAGTKISEASLNPAELKALQTVRQASDLINDTNFSMGKISHETWLKGKDGKYLTRAYEEFDIPSELKDSPFTAGKGKLETGGYMKRKEVDTWKQENAIKDPFYLASKRIQSTMRNKSITDYATWINKNADMVSDTPKKGYTQLSESAMWGELSGKNVRHDVLTDMKGFYSDSKALQGVYDGLNAYDKFAPRQILKSSKTVLNPATRLGNQTSNRVFAAMNGVNLAKFEWNMHKFAPQELANNGKYARLLRKEGILGTDMTKYELAKTLVKDGVEQSKMSKVLDKAKSSYGAADDKAKLSAFKYWLDKGKTTDEAIIKVRNGFQDYSKVGLLYDVAAKTPLIGKPFIRFQSELARIIKNSATENPLSLALVVGAIAATGEISSRLSGETPEDKATREGRFGTPVIPFTQIPLVFQTPIGEVNVARMFGMYETAGADTTNKNIVQRASKYLPFDVPTSKEDVIKSLGNDVLLGGIANQATDTDFRGKSISDPNSNKYQPSTLTDTEKIANRAGALYRNYQIPFVNDVENVGRSVLGLKDQYGKTKTPLQAGSKLTGFKIEQFGAKEAADQRAKDAVYADYDKKDAAKQINAVLKDQAEGKIDAKTAQSRINGLNSKTGATTNKVQSSGKVFSNPNGGFSYLDDNGSLQTEKTQALADLAVSKSEFKKSDKNLEIVGDNVLRKNSNGDVQVTTKDAYDYDIGTSKLNNLKRSDDVEGWIKQANVQLDLLDKQYKDPNADELDKIDIQNKADTLMDNIDKYTGYGGFTKYGKGGAAKKASIAKILASSKAMSSTTNDTMKKLNSLLLGTTTSKPTIRKAQLKQITVKGARS